MTDFIVIITDPVQLAGITWARQQHNAALSPPPDTVVGGMAEPAPTSTSLLETDEAYVQWVMEQAAISYADQQLRDEHRQNYEDALSARSARSD